MKNKAPVWEPSEIIFAEREDAMTDFRVEVISRKNIARVQRIVNSLSTSGDDAVYFTDDEKLFNALNGKVDVSRVGASKGRHCVASESLSQKWFISPEAERRTLQHTTQRGIRTILHPSLSRQF